MARTAIAPPGPTRRLLRPAVAFVAAAALSLVPIQPAIAGPPSILPQGGSVAAGHATIGAASNNNLTVNQGSQNAVINWNSFSIGQPNTVTYHQPNAASATLNRVTGNTPSSIAGRLNANGQIRNEKILRRFVYHHPLFTLDSMRAQQRWNEISGVRRTHFAGAYWLYGFHEDGVNSALRVARALGVQV